MHCWYAVDISLVQIIYQLNLDKPESYLRTIFGFVGITNMQFFNVQPMDVSLDTRKAAYKKAINEVREYAKKSNWQLDEGAEEILFPVGLKPLPITA